MADSTKTCTLEVFRYHPEQDSEPRFQKYEVPFSEDWVVLDALNHIKGEIDGSVTYRWSCRMGVCGSCGMMVNGTPRLTCSTFLKEFYPSPIRIEPLGGFPVIRDLVVNLDDFLEKLTRVQAWLIPKENHPEVNGALKQTPAELADYKQFSMCINCMLCYAACPVYAQEPHFLGPAAITLAHRYNLDSRDGARAARLDVISSDPGVWECAVIEECSAVCPKGVDPASAIQQVKLEGATDWWRGMLIPKEKRGG